MGAGGDEEYDDWVSPPNEDDDGVEPVGGGRTAEYSAGDTAQVDAELAYSEEGLLAEHILGIRVRYGNRCPQLELVIAPPDDARQDSLAAEARDLGPIEVELQATGRFPSSNARPYLMTLLEHVRAAAQNFEIQIHSIELTQGGGSDDGGRVSIDAHVDLEEEMTRALDQLCAYAEKCTGDVDAKVDCFGMIEGDFQGWQQYFEIKWMTLLSFLHWVDHESDLLHGEPANFQVDLLAPRLPQGRIDLVPPETPSGIPRAVRDYLARMERTRKNP